MLGHLLKKANIPAKVAESTLGVSLNTYESHTTYRMLAKNSLKPRIVQSLRNQFCKIAPNTWDSRFFIDTKGKIVVNPTVLNSTEFLDYYQSAEANHYKIPFAVMYAIPNLLYSIDQTAWDHFISRLPDQDVAKQLNLSHHRHLWPAYNYAVDADKSILRKYRATYFSEFHFLLDYIPKYALTSAYLPCPYFSLLNDHQTGKALYLIDQNQTPVGDFLEMLKLPSAPFLNKFSHCPTWYYLQKISELVIARATNVHHEINLRKLNEFVAALPPSKKNPVEFSSMVRQYENIKWTYKDERPLTALPFKAHFFYHNRLNFNETTEVKVGLNAIEDYIEELAENLVFPQFIRQILALDDFEDHFSNISEVLETAIHITKIAILENTNQKTLNLLTERWHRNLTVIEALKPPQSIFCKEWHALFSEVIINNMTFTCLNTDTKIKEEGILLKHCVGGYGGRCKRGQSHIVRAISKSGERATLELTYEKEQFTLAQCLGISNTFPGFQLKDASEQLV